MDPTSAARCLGLQAPLAALTEAEVLRAFRAVRERSGGAG